MEASTLRPRPCMHASPALAALVLIVEDEAEIADILTAYLEREGLRTLRAADGHSALDLHRSARPDLVLLDVQLPRLDGWSVLTQLRQRGETPVIMLTALDQDLDKLTALRMGADDYVVKPFNPAEVAARVRAVLRRTLRGSRVDAPTALRAGPLLIDSATHAVHVEGDGYSHEVLLTLTEFAAALHGAGADPHLQPQRTDARMPAGKRGAGAHGRQPCQQSCAASWMKWAWSMFRPACAVSATG